MGSTNWKTRAVPVGRVLFSCPMPLMALCIAAANLDVGCSGPPSSVTFMVHDVLGHIRSEVPLGSIYLPSSFHLILSSCEMVPCVSLCVCVLNCNNNKQQTTNNKQQTTNNNKQQTTNNNSSSSSSNRRAVLVLQAKTTDHQW